MKYGNFVSTHYIDRTGYEPLAGFLGEETQEAIFTKPILEKMTEDMKTKTNSQVGNKPPEYTGKTVAEFEEDVRNGMQISLSDFAQALNAERSKNNRPAVSKGRPSLMEQVEIGKQLAAKQSQSDNQKNKNLEV
jgi:hypothetical protein